jgi:hypothetical protein
MWKGGVKMLKPKVPTKITLEKYGLNPELYRLMAECQGNVCYVCQKLPKSERLNVDHFHVKGFKKMAPEEKRKHIRGLLCFFCNRYYVGRCITIAKAKRVVEYLEAYERRFI